MLHEDTMDYLFIYFFLAVFLNPQSAYFESVTAFQDEIITE